MAAAANHGTNGMERFVRRFVEHYHQTHSKPLPINKAPFQLADDKDQDDMLRWGTGGDPLEIQEVEWDNLLSNQLLRVGTVGDGSCLIHAILFATSHTYRNHSASAKTAIADAFRTHLFQIRGQLLQFASTQLFPPEENQLGIGMIGAEESANSLEILQTKKGPNRQQISFEIGHVIAQYYGFNFIPIRIVEDSFEPEQEEAAYYKFDDRFPTILIHYMGHQGYGHYETIIDGDLEEVSKGFRIEDAQFALTPHHPVLVEQILPSFDQGKIVMYHRIGSPSGSPSGSPHGSPHGSPKGSPTKKKSSSPLHATAKKSGKPPIFPPSETKKVSPKGSPKNKTQKNLASAMKVLSVNNAISNSEKVSFGDLYGLTSSEKGQLTQAINKKKKGEKLSDKQNELYLRCKEYLMSIKNNN
jgi:hypothetical protein